MWWVLPLSGTESDDVFVAVGGGRRMHLFGVDALSSEEAGRIVGGGRDGLAVVWLHIGA